jgi:hypothetical protein
MRSSVQFSSSIWRHLTFSHHGTVRLNQVAVRIGYIGSLVWMSVGSGPFPFQLVMFCCLCCRRVGLRFWQYLCRRRICSYLRHCRRLTVDFTLILNRCLGPVPNPNHTEMTKEDFGKDKTKRLHWRLCPQCTSRRTHKSVNI